MSRLCADKVMLTDVVAMAAALSSGKLSFTYRLGTSKKQVAHAYLTRTLSRRDTQHSSTIGCLLRGDPLYSIMS